MDARNRLGESRTTNERGRLEESRRIDNKKNTIDNN